MATELRPEKMLTFNFRWLAAHQKLKVNILGRWRPEKLFTMVFRAGGRTFFATMLWQWRLRICTFFNPHIGAAHSTCATKIRE